MLAGQLDRPLGQQGLGPYCCCMYARIALPEAAGMPCFTPRTQPPQHSVMVTQQRGCLSLHLHTCRVVVACPTPLIWASSWNLSRRRSRWCRSRHSGCRQSWRRECSGGWWWQLWLVRGTTPVAAAAFLWWLHVHALLPRFASIACGRCMHAQRPKKIPLLSRHSREGGGWVLEVQCVSSGSGQAS